MLSESWPLFPPLPTAEVEITWLFGDNLVYFSTSDGKPFGSYPYGAVRYEQIWVIEPQQRGPLNGRSFAEVHLYAGRTAQVKDNGDGRPVLLLDNRSPPSWLQSLRLRWRAWFK